MVYSKSGKGYLTENGILKLKSVFGNDIFRNEQYKLFKVFEAELTSGELESYQNTYRVSNLFHKDNSVVARIVTDNPPLKNLTRVTPKLEDLYLYVFEEGK